MELSRFVVLVAVGGLLVAGVGDATDRDEPDPVAQVVAGARADDWAWDWLEGLCDGVGPRLAGSDALDAAAEYAVRTFTAAGFDRVWTEPVAVPHWVRGTESAELTAPVRQPLAIIGLGRSVATPAEGLEAAVMVVASFDELEARADQAAGKIVVFDYPWTGYGAGSRYRFGAATAAARHGAVAALVRSAASASLGAPHTGSMSYDEEVPKIPTAALTVEDAGRVRRLVEHGAAVRIRLVMTPRTLPDRVQHTVLAELRGAERPEEIVLLGAHLDSWDVGTGAHDDGAGCAMVAGAAHAMLAAGLRPRRTVRVVLYASEEYGGHAGDAYLEAHQAELGRHVAALESDSGCFPPDGFSVRTDDPTVLGRLALLAAPLSELGAGTVRPGWAGVDIGPIVEHGVPGLAYRTHNERYFDYHHSAADTLDKVDPADLRAGVAAIAGLAWAVADAPEPLRSVR